MSAAGILRKAVAQAVARLPGGGEQVHAFEGADDGFNGVVALDVEAVAGGVLAEVGEFEGGGDEGDVEGVVVDGGDGEGDAIDGDGALGDEVFGQVSGEAEGGAPLAVGGVGGVGADEFTGAVDVTLEDVAVEAVGEAHGPFGVDFGAGGELAEVG